MAREEVAESREVVVDTARPIRCAACGQIVTDESARIARLGRHVHECTNPAGMVYRVACFASARGMSVATNPSREWSWFPGYAWQIELCDGCRVHLGWKYTRGDEVFFGLIEDRLR
jgi:hypothetical protein